MKEYFVVFFLFFGVAFILLAAIGLLRFPDIYMRISATTKSATLGVASMLIAVIIHFWELDITGRTIATIVFLFSTAPIASQMIGRASYFIGVSMWIKSKKDQMREQYDQDTHSLKGIDHIDLPVEGREGDEEEKSN